MKKSYLSTVPLISRPWLWVVLLMGLFAPLAMQAQSMSYQETFNGLQARETITSAQAAGEFDEDQLVYSGTAIASPGVNPNNNNPSNYAGASGGRSIVFAEPSPTTQGVQVTANTDYTLIIDGLNTTTAGTGANPRLEFGLFRSAGSQTAATNEFIAEYSLDGGANYTNIGFTRPAASGSWEFVAVNTTIPAATNVRVRFTRVGNASTRQYRLDDFMLRALSPALFISPASLIFPNTTVGTQSAAQQVTVTGTDLTGPVTVTAPSGFLVRTGSDAYASTAVLTQDGSGGVSQQVDVVFVPTATGSYFSQISAASPGATTVATNVAGNATAPPPSLTVSPIALPDFGSVQVGQVSAAQTFNIQGSNLTNNVVVTPPAGFQIRLPNGTFSSAAITLVPSAGSVNQNVEVRFQPTVDGNYNAQVAVTSTGAPASGVSVSGTATPAPTGPFIVANPTAIDFGTVSASGSAQTLTFSVNAGNLTAPLVLTGSNNNIVFRDATAGGSFVNGPIIINPAPNGSVSIRNIEVQLTGPIASGPFSGSITASSTGATSVVVTITANSTGNNSVINASGNLSLFSTVPGVASSVQSYTLSGSNLLQDITVTAPQYFQVSLDATFAGVTTTGNTIVVPRNSGPDVTATTVYVRFLPPSALSSSSLILNSSSPAVSQGIPVAGTSEPTIQIANAFQEVRNVVINTTSASQALTINAQRVLQPVTISKNLSTNPLNPGNVPQFELSLDNVTFTNSVVLTPNATTYSINQPIYVRYKPTYLGSAQSTLQFQSNDFANKSVQAFGANDLLSARSIDIEPTLRSTATVTRNNTTATVSFNLPANYAALGYGEGRLIVASTNSELPANSQPADGNSYQTGNQTYGQGPQIAPGFFAVYSGSNQTVVVDGLDLATTYYFYTFEYNNIDNNFNVSVIGAENYLSPPVPNTIPGIIAPSPLPVTLVSFSAKVKGNQVALNWVTASELNNKGFEVQRSRDGRSFETILTREGKGTTSATTTYNEVDKKPLNGLSYYRLKQVDLDGSSSFSSLVTVNFLNSGEVTMYPNPVQDQLTIDVAGSAEGVTAVITDMTGRLISTRKLGADSKLDMTNLQAGTYLVTVGEGDAKVTRRIVKK
ncbi:T9SS type A sorting domain-containing protein [Hymenobacter perfusus]|uniref:T9SS C-terminal target domain-containing protein n=1 Tax=Hymenobacter perfusus TaxID=1236770 RepID=A0A428K9X1_9BACT|nr:T9SS type A sorting domain-containing protein [Hymenobacter perfusus]RSK43237.1 T9SS C-terminal target domain-containing protein [Hymenobacter perfusus]